MLILANTMRAILVGAWFTFPIDEEDVKEKIGLNEQYEEYAIHDTDNFFIIFFSYQSIDCNDCSNTKCEDWFTYKTDDCVCHSFTCSKQSPECFKQKSKQSDDKSEE